MQVGWLKMKYKLQLLMIGFSFAYATGDDGNVTTLGRTIGYLTIHDSPVTIQTYSKATLDRSFKYMLFDKSIAKHFIQTFAPESVEIQELEFSNLSTYPWDGPEPYKGEMDFSCKITTQNNRQILINIEMQSEIDKNWEKRAVLYLSTLYSNQIKSGGKPENLKEVWGINILEKEPILGDRKSQEMGPLKLVQYSLTTENPSYLTNQPIKDWFTLLKKGYEMNEAMVNRDINTPEVLAAFERLKLRSLVLYKPLFQENAVKIKQLTIALNLIDKNMNQNEIAEITELNINYIEILTRLKAGQDFNQIKNEINNISEGIIKSQVLAMLDEIFELFKLMKANQPNSAASGKESLLNKLVAQLQI